MITGCCATDVGWVLGVMPVLVDAVGCWFSLRLVCGLLLGCCVGLIVLLMLVLFVMAFVVWLLDLRCDYLVLRWLVALFMLCSYDSALVLSGFVVSCGCLLLSSFADCCLNLCYTGCFGVLFGFGWLLCSLLWFAGASGRILLVDLLGIDFAC